MIELFKSYIVTDDSLASLLSSTYEPWLIVLSYVIAVCSSILAFQLLRLAKDQSSAISKPISILSSSVSLGAGIWAMHFIGMLALNICTEVKYNPFITIFSMLPGTLACYYALYLLSEDNLSHKRIIAGGAIVGAGIGLMHYTGMLAMQMNALLRFNLNWVLLSIVVAISLATLSLWLGVVLNNQKGKLPKSTGVVISGLVMGSAIAAMHYTGMASARFIGENNTKLPDVFDGHAVSMSLGITLVTLLIGILAASVNALARYKQTLATLQASETRLSTILNTAIDGIITINTKGDILSFNTVAEQLFGWKADEVIGKNINILMPNPHHSNHDDYLKNYLKSGQAKIIGVGREVEGLRKDGSLFPIRLAIGKVVLSNETLFVGFITDLTPRREMEIAVREKDEQLQSMIANIPGIAFRCNYDNNWSMQFISNRVLQLTGWEAQDFLDGTIHFPKITNPEDSARILPTVEAAVKNHQHYNVEYRITDRNGEEKWVSEFGSGIYDENNNITMLDGVIIDITESKRRNAAYQGIVRAINYSTSIAEFSVDGYILTANQNFLSLLGYTLEEVIGLHHSIFCSEEDAKSARYKKKWKSLRNGEFVHGEFLRLGKDKREVWINAFYSPVKDFDNKINKVIMFMIDITERKKMENDLRDAKNIAEQAASVKSTFLANMSHEIRTPMNAIIGFTELMLDTEMRPDQQSYVSTINNSAKSLLHLLNDILDSAKLEKGMLELESFDFSMNELVDSVISTLWLQARKKELDLQLEISEEATGYYYGSAHRIRQVLMNLLGNAIKFTDAGSVKLKVYAQAPDTLCFDVIDTGIGIAADRLDAIFEPFTQADASMSRRFGGTGLGTTISKQLVEAMGGTISASSQLGHGSCFSISLPLKKGEEKEQLTLDLVSKLPPMRILVADDIAQNRELLKIILIRDGHEVTLVSNGEEVLEQYANHPFDIILMDVQMPKVDGLTATRRIRSLELENNTPRTPIIALTASVLEEDRVAAKEASMDGFATKPIELANLTREMARVLNISDTLAPQTINEKEPLEADFRADRGIALWGSEQTYYAQLKQFIQQHTQAINEVRHAVATNDFTLLNGLAHAHKGVTANLSITKLQRIYGEIESAAHHQNQKLLPSLMSQLETAWQSLNNTIQNIVTAEVHDTISNNDQSASKILALLHQLRELTVKARLDDTLMQDINTAMPANMQLELSMVGNALNEFEFEQALMAIDKLIEKLN
ncbi:PAS domain S-box protein [Methylotenera sp.]|uniref:PAS domain S-box protein n=1 Tax=Methylotenera sp. TaxID=2051956 RepID=UPI002EDA9DB4